LRFSALFYFYFSKQPFWPKRDRGVPKRACLFATAHWIVLEEVCGDAAREYRRNAIPIAPQSAQERDAFLEIGSVLKIIWEIATWRIFHKIANTVSAQMEDGSAWITPDPVTTA
jgi:hypothetical protein